MSNLQVPLDTLPALNMVGCGRLGQVLGRLLHDKGLVRLQDVHTRSLASAEHAVAQMEAGDAQPVLTAMRPAEIWMLAVPDGQIKPMSEAVSAAWCSGMASLHTGLANSQRKPMPLVFHCSGALASSELLALQSIGWQVASCHPILSFAQFDRALQQFPGTACALEGDDLAVAMLTNLFVAIGAQCFVLPAAQKLLYHAGAVFISNFLPVLQQTARELWTASGVPPDIIQKLAPTMLDQVSQNVIALGPKAALTGPAARGDVELVAAQAQALAAWNPDAAEAYRGLSALAMQLAKRPF
jgi:predicted short-subunit dehydrogenase-like oxidoreductase (DUF2520 family)